MPPVRKLMSRGARLEKSFDGETTLAAMFTFRVATRERDESEEGYDRLMEAAQQRNRAPDGLAEDDFRC